MNKRPSLFRYFCRNSRFSESNYPYTLRRLVLSFMSEICPYQESRAVCVCAKFRYDHTNRGENRREIFNEIWHSISISLVERVPVINSHYFRTYHQRSSLMSAGAGKFCSNAKCTRIHINRLSFYYSHSLITAYENAWSWVWMLRALIKVCKLWTCLDDSIVPAPIRRCLFFFQMHLESTKP